VSQFFYIYLSSTFLGKSGFHGCSDAFEKGKKNKTLNLSINQNYFLLSLRCLQKNDQQLST
jgi:hypothetical protein